MRRIAPSIALLVLVSLASPVFGSLIIDIGSATIDPGNTVSVDVTIRNAAGFSDDLSVYNFLFDIIPPGPNILQFLNPQPDTQLGDPNYVFPAGSFKSMIGFPVGEVGPLNDDTTFNEGDFIDDPDVPATVQPTSADPPLLLVTLVFTANGPVPPQPGEVYIIRLVHDANTIFYGSAFELDYTSNEGQIRVTGQDSPTDPMAAVPEPRTLVPLIVSIVAALTIYWRKQASGWLRLPGDVG